MVRRIAAAPNHYALGMVANGMTVWDLDDARASELGARVGALDFVSHAYLRPRVPPDWPYNLFAMVHGRDRAEVEAQARRDRGAARARLRAPRHPLLHPHPEEDRPAPGRGSRLMFRLSEYMHDLVAPEPAPPRRRRAAGTGQAGGDLEPDPALQPALPALLHRVGRRRLPGRADPRAGDGGARRPRGVPHPGADPLGRRAAVAARLLHPGAPRAPGLPLPRALHQRHRDRRRGRRPDRRDRLRLRRHQPRRHRRHQRLVPRPRGRLRRGARRHPRLRRPRHQGGPALHHDPGQRGRAAAHARALRRGAHRQVLPLAPRLRRPRRQAPRRGRRPRPLARGDRAPGRAGLRRRARPASTSRS